MAFNQAVTLNLSAGHSKTKLYEFPVPGATGITPLYNSDGIEITYGYEDNKKRYNYGALDSNNNEIVYGGIENSAGLHSIKLSRELRPGEEIRLTWRNGYELIIFNDGTKTKAKKRVGGSYQEIGKWKTEDGSSEYTCQKFNDSVFTKRFDYIETKTFKEF